MKRCSFCLIKQDACICEWQPDIDTQIATLLIVSENEVLKPSNTGRLIADVVNETYVYQWDRTQPDPDMLALIASDQYQPIIVFPEEYVDDKERLLDIGKDVIRENNQRTPLLIFIDGSWREARKIFRRSAYLQSIPVISIEPEQVSQYLMRKSENEQHLSTVEVASLVLKEIGEKQAAYTLNLWFEVFKESYMLSKTRYKSDLTRPSMKRFIEHIKNESSL